MIFCFCCGFDSKAAISARFAQIEETVLVDEHRSDVWKAETDKYEVQLETLPNVARLAELEVHTVMHLCEAPIGTLPKPNSPYWTGLAEKGESIPIRFREWFKAGAEINRFGIDIVWGSNNC